jgi:radical SAM protein with 4Fe4S-binding SPASM domain
MQQVLDPSMSLFREGDRIALRRRTWPAHYPQFQVHPVCAIILALLDGQRTREDVADVIAQVFSLPRDAAAETTRLTLRKYERFLTAPDLLDGRRPVVYDPIDFVISAPPSERLLPRETVPQYIWWRVTRYCNRRCKYCCVAARHALKAPDATLSFDRVREIFTEGADIGVRGVSLSGGEPFIRQDTVEVIELLLGLRYEVDVDTKFALSDVQIGRLAAAGLPVIHVSLDSPNADTANYLVGDNTFFHSIRRSIRSLIKHGIRVTITSVLTERNVRELPLLVKFLADLGVEQLTLNTFSRYYGQCRYVKAFELSTENKAWLREIVPALQQQYDGWLRIIYDRNFSAEAATCTTTEPAVATDPELTLNCDQGIRILRMLPDGRVSRCDQWWHEEEVVFGDLRHQSIYEAWSSPALREMIYPERERFNGTACASCDIFDACNSTGRCIFASHETHGTVYAPDNHCFRKAVS